MMHMRTFLPRLQDDETIYSWCATAHAMGDWRCAQEWSAAMLGASHATRQLDLPAYLPGLLNAILPRQTLAQALRHHSTVGMFLPFVKAPLMERLREHGGPPNAGWPHPPQFMRKALLCHSRTLSWQAELRYCPDCVRADIARVGRAYWHTPHQWPVSRVCTVHLVPLMSFHASAKTWHLPPRSVESSPLAFSPVGASEISMLIQRVAMAISQFDAINTKSLRSAALLRLKQIGVIHSMHAVRHERLHAWYLSQPTSSWCATAGGGLENLARPDWLPKLLWRRTQDHPIRWIIAWASLAWGDPMSAVQALKDTQADHAADEYGQLALFASPSPSHLTGAPVPRAMPESMRVALESECSYAGLMTKLRISRSDIVRWLEADPESRRIWRARLQQGRIEAAVSSLVQHIRSLPTVSRDELNTIANKEISLLRRHAPHRLVDLLRAVPSRMDAQKALFP